jgi:hypothetical protein
VAGLAGMHRPSGAIQRQHRLCYTAGVGWLNVRHVAEKEQDAGRLRIRNQMGKGTALARPQALGGPRTDHEFCLVSIRP